MYLLTLLKNRNWIYPFFNDTWWGNWFRHRCNSWPYLVLLDVSVRRLFVCLLSHLMLVLNNCMWIFLNASNWLVRIKHFCYKYIFLCLFINAISRSYIKARFLYLPKCNLCSGLLLTFQLQLMLSYNIILFILRLGSDFGNNSAQEIFWMVSLKDLFQLQPTCLIFVIGSLKDTEYM